MRRSAALILAVALVSPLSLRIASPAAIPLDLAKLTPAMRELVANRGYKDPAAIAKAVHGFRRGNVYYLAKVSGSLDRSLLRDLQRAGAHVRVAFPEISWVALSSMIDSVKGVANLRRVERLDVDGVQKILGASVQYVSASAARKWGDQHRRGTVDVGADKMWAAGITGTGVTVGVADSGFDSTHPDLDNLDWLNWGGSHPKKSSFVDCQTGLSDIETIVIKTPPLKDLCNAVPGYDDNGHGTHVSGIATGTAEGRGNQNGLYPGMAPGALLSVAKVCTAAGTCLNSNVMAGMRYLAMEKSEGGAGADIINMSLGGSRTYGSPLFGASMETNHDVEAQLVNALSQKDNVLFVIAAGNSGPVLGSVADPAVASQSLAVGASIADFDLDHPVDQTLHGEFGNIQPAAKRDHAIGIAAFSSRGPSGDRLVKPDVVAPGVYVVAPEALLGGEVHAGDFGHQNHFSYDPTYAVLSGTSMASPSAAGVAALVWSGYERALGAAPAYYRIKAALANTAGTKAFEGSVAGLIFGTLVHNGVGTLADHYPTRNAGPVGVTGIGAGRVNAPAALLALTRGVIAYTPQRGPLDSIRELQSSWGMDDIAPGGSARTTFMFLGAPKLRGPAPITFRMLSDPEPAGTNLTPTSWFTLPRGARVSRNQQVPVSFGLRVPAGAKPGGYEGTILGRVDLGKGVHQNIRIPVQFFVRMTEPNAGVGGTSVEGPVWASDVTDYSLVGYENPLGDIYTDWTMIPVYVPKGATRVDFSVYDVAGKDTMDLFVFDNAGNEIDSTVTGYTRHAVPGGVLYRPTSKRSPATMSILSSSVDGSDTTDLQKVTLPQTIWLAVSDSKPANPAKMARFHLGVDMIGAASPWIGGVTISAPAPAPWRQPGSLGEHMPATGVGVPQGLAVALLAAAVALGAWPRARRSPNR